MALPIVKVYCKEVFVSKGFRSPSFFLQLQLGCVKLLKETRCRKSMGPFAYAGENNLMGFWKVVGAGRLLEKKRGEGTTHVIWRQAYKKAFFFCTFPLGFKSWKLFFKNLGSVKTKSNVANVNIGIFFKLNIACW